MERRKPYGFDERLAKSIELLKKAEKYAMMYDSTDGFYLAFSGGKDSQAIYHVAKLAGVRFRAHMNLTSVDPPEVIRFVRTQYPDVEMIKPKDSIFNIAVKKMILPTQTMRWCCAEYKEQSGAGKVVIIGIRHAESNKRAKKNQIELRGRKFSGSFEGFEQYRDKVTNGSSTTTCIHGKDSLLVSPIIEWSESDVWYFLDQVVHTQHCCLYDEGRTRIGCIACPFATTRNQIKDLKRWPHFRRNWLRAIEKMQEIAKQNGRPHPFDTPEQEFEWWISKQNMKSFIANKRLQTEINFDE